MIKIETNRFLIREILPTDIEGMFELHSDPEVHRYLGNNFITTRDEAMGLGHDDCAPGLFCTFIHVLPPPEGGTRRCRELCYATADCPDADDCVARGVIRLPLTLPRAIATRPVRTISMTP